MRKIAITDIHGCAQSMKSLVETQVVLEKEDELYLLGDYIDRGPDSKGVIDYIFSLKEAGYQVRCLKGNHEEMLMKAYKNAGEVDFWLYNGGRETLNSFGIREVTEIGQEYMQFFEELEYFFEVDNYILVHAGLNFKGKSSNNNDQGFLWQLHNPLRDYHSMLWIRYWYGDINRDWLKGRVIVHGHTPVETNEIWDMYDLMDKEFVLDIDNGCFAKNNSGMGQLCAFDLTRRELYFQKNID